MPNTLRAIPAPRRIARLLAGCALAAIAALPAAAAAQGLQGTPTAVVGTPLITTGANYTGIFPNTQQTVINWVPFDTGGSGTIDFLPSTATVEFNDPGGALGDFTVLNRIIPVDFSGTPVARAIALNGSVFGRIVNDPGGHIWFYSPTGIIAGAGSTFSVGSLILTTNDIQFVADVAGTPGSIYGAGGLVQFIGPAGSTGFVQIQGPAGALQGAQINASGANAYVALVAPRVVQGGTVNVNGHAAYLAAEVLDMTINAGLFDFTLLVGTTDANGVVHTGTTTGPASTGIADQQRISMVALPKNTALTMLLSGSVGYAAAASVDDDGSSIVLSAGFGSAQPNGVPGNAFGNIQIGNTTFGNRLDGYASNNVIVAPTGGTIDFQGDTRLFALNSITMTAETSEQIFGTALSLSAGGIGAGGTIDVLATGKGRIAMTERLDLLATSDAATFAAGAFTDGTGGTINLTANDGTVSAPIMILNATGTGSGAGLVGGNGIGGTITARVLVGGTLTSASFSMVANGFGAYGPDVGGNGIGGTLTLTETNGQLDFGTVALTANGIGSFSAGEGGSGTGGRIAVALNNQAQAWDSLNVNANASAAGGILGAGSANGLADAISLALNGPASLTVTGSVNLISDARVVGNTAAGVDSVAGGVSVTVGTGATLAAGGTINARANADYGIEGPPLGEDTTPNVQGGTVSIVSRGTITAAGLNAIANATSASAVTRAGTATGGTVTVTAAGGGSIRLDDGAGGGGLLLAANAFGAPGTTAAHALGGTARLIAEGGSITALGAATVEANGRALLLRVSDGPGFDATGGTAGVELRVGSGGTSSITAGSLDVRANGDARPLIFNLVSGMFEEGPLTGDGGTGQGGNASLSQVAGTLNVGRVTLQAAGLGATSAAIDGLTGFTSGDGFGGTTLFSQSGGIAAVTTLELFSHGSGGGGAAAAIGGEIAALAGNGTGGNATLDVIGGTLDVTDTTIAALGFGGAGMNHNGGSAVATDGGIGTGGTARLQSPNGATGAFTTTTLAIRSNGSGGVGGNAPDGTSGSGGSGVGGNASIALADGAFALGAVTIEAIGRGGNGNVGGEGRGGRALFQLIDSAAGATGTRGLAGLTLDGSGIGGLDSGGGTAESDAGEADWTVEVNSPGTALAVTGSLRATSLGSRLPAATAGVAGTNNGSGLAVGGDILINTSGAVTIDALLPMSAGGVFDATGLSFTSVGLITSGGAMSIVGTDAINAAQLTSGGITELRAVNGPVLVADLLSAGNVTALGRSIDLASTGALTFADLDATAGALAVQTAGDLTLATADATGAVTLRSTGGALRATGNVNGASIALTAAAGVQADANLTATGALAVDAGGTFTLAGTGRGTTITVASADIALGTAAALGVRGTTTALTLTNRDPSRTMFIGGPANATGYSLDQAEALRLFADNSITLGVALAGPPPPAGQGTIVVNDLAMGFGANRNIGTGGELEISTPGRVSIIGDVALTTSGATDTFSIDPTLIELDTSTGSIAMLDGTGAALGRLVMVGGTISIATTAALAQLGTLTDFAAINALLDTPGGIAQPIRAGTIDLSVTNGLFIQNTGASGAFADRRGFLAGALNITTASAATRLAINGQIVTAGGPVSGLDTVGAIRINGAVPAAGGLFAAGSTVNGCAIGGNCALVPVPPPAPDRPDGPDGPDAPDAPTGIDLESPVPPGDGGDGLLIAPLIELAVTDPLIAPPLVDEPITGVGNDDLWQAACADPETDNCEAEDQP